MSLADEGQSIVVRVNRQQYHALTAGLGDARLVPKDVDGTPLR
jgi:hypothetical protein